MTVPTGKITGKADVDLQCGRSSALENRVLDLVCKGLKEGGIGEVLERAPGLLGCCRRWRGSARFVRFRSETFGWRGQVTGATAGYDERRRDERGGAGRHGREMTEKSSDRDKEWQ